MATVGANAALLDPVETWSVSTSSYFSQTPGDVVFESAPGPSVTSNIELFWGDLRGNSSALTLGPAANFDPPVADPEGPEQTVVFQNTVSTVGVNGVASGDPGTIGINTALTHRNQTVILRETPVLQSGVLRTDVTLVPDGRDDSAFDRSVAIPFSFEETPNRGSNGVCPNGEAPPANGCSDLFVIPTSDLFDVFEFEGNTYTTRLFATDETMLVELTAGECSAVGFADGCIGFATLEAQENTVQFAFEILSGDMAAVPLPPAVLLFASGLLGVGLIARRRQGA